MSNITEALDIIAREQKELQDRKAALLAFANLDKETERLQAEKEYAQQDCDEAVKELARLRAKIEQAEREVVAAVDNVANRIEDESKRVQAPLQKVKDELRTFRTKANQERERITRENNDLRAQTAQLTGTLKSLEANLADRRRESENLGREMVRDREQWAQEKRDMERELQKVGNSEDIKEEVRLAKIKAITEKEAIAREIRDMKATQLQVSNDLVKLNANLADRKREMEAADKSAMKALGKYVEEKQALLEEIRQLKAKQVDLQTKNARLSKSEARV